MIGNDSELDDNPDSGIKVTALCTYKKEEALSDIWIEVSEDVFIKKVSIQIIKAVLFKKVDKNEVQGKDNILLLDTKEILNTKVVIV